MKQITATKILQQTEEFYNDIAFDFSQTRYRVWPGLERFRDLTHDGDRILDLGCGNGRLAEIFRDKKIDYLGVDNSAGLIKAAQDKFSGDSRHQFAVGDIIDFPLPAQYFDLILLVAVLHHLPARALRLKVLKSAAAALKPGSKILITNWNLWQKKYRRHLFSWRKISRGIYSLNDALVPWKSGGKIRWRYVHNFTKSEIKSLLTEAGFQTQEIYYDRAGQRADWFNGENIVVLAKKAV